MNKDSMLIMLQDRKTIISLDNVSEFRSNRGNIYAYKNISGGNNIALGTYNNDDDVEEVLAQLLDIRWACGIYTMPKENEIVRSKSKMNTETFSGNLNEEEIEPEEPLFNKHISGLNEQKKYRETILNANKEIEEEKKQRDRAKFNVNPLDAATRDKVRNYYVGPNCTNGGGGGLDHFSSNGGAGGNNFVKEDKVKCGYCGTVYSTRLLDCPNCDIVPD